MKTVWSNDKQELNITINPVVDATCNGGTPRLSNIGRIIKPPPIPTIVASIPAITEEITSYIAIFGVITNYFDSSTYIFSHFFSLN